MSGDWIKMRGNLWDDPRIGALVEATGTTEATVIGGLYWLWITADQHTESGFMPGFTLKQIDRKTSIPGLGAALVEINWISEQKDGVVLENFTEHNGASAKRRSSDAKRKASVRIVSACDADKGRTESGQAADKYGHRVELEIEKRREELIPPPGGGGAAADRRIRTPQDERKSGLWRSIKALLVDCGESKDLKAAGAVITKAITRYDEATALNAIEAALHARPAGVIAYIEAACQQATGKRLNKQEELEASNLAAAERFAAQE